MVVSHIHIAGVATKMDTADKIFHTSCNRREDPTQRILMEDRLNQYLTKHGKDC